MEVHFEIENRCLLQCRHCSSNAGAAGKTMEYELKDMASFLGRLPGHKTVFFTGGEPLLNKNYELILRTLKKDVPNISLGMFTSGILENGGEMCPVSEEYAELLVNSGLEICYFSIYDVKEKEHDWMTGRQGSFQITEASVKHFLTQGADIRFNLVVTQKNKGRILDIIDLASSWGGSEVRLLKLVNHGRAEKSWNTIGIKEEDYSQIVRQTYTDNEKIRITASSCTDILPCRPMPNAEKCQAGTRLLYVTFEGAIFPCACVKNNPRYMIGNIKEDIDWHKYFEKRGTCNKRALCAKV